MTNNGDLPANVYFDLSPLEQMMKALSDVDSFDEEGEMDAEE